VAFGGKTIVVALEDGHVQVLDADDLAVKHKFRPAGDKPPRFAASSPGGRWLSVLFHNHSLWMYDTQQGREASFSISSRAGISGVAFDGPNSLLVADRANRVTQYELDPFRVAEERAPALDNMEIAYYYGIVPLYTVLPKPGELGNVVEYLLTEKSTVPGGLNPLDLADKRKDVGNQIYRRYEINDRSDEQGFLGGWNANIREKPAQKFSHVWQEHQEVSHASSHLAFFNALNFIFWLFSRAHRFVLDGVQSMNNARFVQVSRCAVVW
jgi:hypothetical protein